MQDAPSTLQRIDDDEVQAIANEASADKRSVTRRLAGLPVKGLAGKRIDAVLARRRTAQLNSNAPAARTA